MALNAMERLQNQQVKKTITFQGRKLIVSGKLGTLAYLGLQPDTTVADSSMVALDVSFTRKAHKKARWYGDTGGANMPQSTVNMVRYKQSSGGTTAGKTIGFEALTDTNGDDKGRKVTGSFSLQGPFGYFVAYMEANRPPKSVTFIGPRGKKVAAPTLSDAAFDALP
jgi:hypothetical protein